MVLNDNNFKQEVLESDIPVLVDFWASWCPPCKMMEPLIGKIKKEFDGIIKMCKVNVDQNKKLSSEYSIAGVPTFILFKNGEVLYKTSGAQNENQLKNIINLSLQ